MGMVSWEYEGMGSKKSFPGTSIRQYVYLWQVPLIGSCKEIQTQYPTSVSGGYNIITQSGAKVIILNERV